MFKELSKEVSKVTLNPHLRWVFVLLLIMYVFSLDQLVTREGNALLKSTGAKLFVMLLVVLLADRDPFMAVLLAVSYLVSLHSLPFLEGMETKMKSDDSGKKELTDSQKKNILNIQKCFQDNGKEIGMVELAEQYLKLKDYKKE
jgi:hypothetical protein